MKWGSEMKELIKIQNEQIGEYRINSVNARDLHKSLGVGKDFSTWIKARLKKTQAELNIDYVVQNALNSGISAGRQNGRAGLNGSISTAPQNYGAGLNGEKKAAPQNGGAGLNKIEYIISLDLAKEIAMLESNEKGREIRKYFIDCERKYIQSQQTQTQHKLPQTFKEALIMLIEQVEQNEKLLEQAQKQKEREKMLFADDTLLTATTIAKELGMNGAEFNRMLSNAKIQYKQNNIWVLYQKYTHDKYGNPSNLMAIKSKKIGDKMITQSFWTQKGRAWILSNIDKISQYR